MEIQERYQSPLRDISNTPNGDLKQGSHAKPSLEAQQRYMLLMKQARKAAEEGHPRESLQLLTKAADICRTEKVLKRIARIEEYLKENGSESESEEDTGMCHVGKGFYLHTELYSKLYSYQREALMWFWKLHRKNKGGILGDDMGLGKTIQVISFLSGLFYLDQVKTVLVILPVALIINWEKEFDKWAPSILVESHHSSSKRERERALAKVQRRGGVLLTSYGLVLTNHDLLSHRHASPFTWDYVILDEGHKIKNPSKTTKAVHKVPATHRIILTGTPIQNNLKELWALFDFVTQGSLLGTSQTFNSEYANPITRAREKDATGGERLLGNQMAESLRELIAPYFLRRTKADVVKRRDEGLQRLEGKDTDADEESEERVPEFPTLTRKNDFVIWLHLTEAQIKIYQDFLSLDQVKELLMTTRSPLVELTILKKLCDHPRLLPVRACIQLGLETAQGAWADEDEDEPDHPNSRHQTGNNAAIQAISDDVLMMESCKLQFLVNLLANLRQEGHRTLVFSQSRKMLDIIEKVLKNKDFEVMRLDGTITKLEDREKRISSFQHNDQLSVFLLTTQVGGVGLTLTGADRVVIFDPSWNPATDSQAVDRVYRIGQTRSVVIYRLITCGSVEEKIYRRQIFKDSLTKQATGTSKNPYRYFSRGELKDLFILDNPQTSTTQLALQEMHAAQRKTDTELDEHIAFLYSLDMFGLSDHDLMFSQEADTENREDQEQAAEYVQHRVSRAKELVSAESDLSQKLKEQIDRDTEGPGSMQRHHHRQYGDRQTLLEHAAALGEEVNVPAFNKRRDDYERTNRSPSESEEIEEDEEEEDLNMSMANMTLEEQRSDVQPQAAKGRPAASLLADRPPSALTAQGASVICIEDSDDEEAGNRSSMPSSRSESQLAVIEDSDTEASTSPVASPRVKSPRAFYGETSEFPRIKAEEAGLSANDEDAIIQDSHSEDEESSYSRQKRFATTPKEAASKKNRMSNTPQGQGRSPGSNGNASYIEEDSIMEVPATPASVIDLTDSDYAEGEAELSQFSFEEVKQRTIATSPLAASRELSPDGSSRPISNATDVGELEKNVDFDYDIESDEGKEVIKNNSEPLPQSDHEASKTSSLSPDDRPESLLEGSYDSSIIEQKSVALSPMISHDDSTASKGSPASAKDLNTSQMQETREDDVDGEFQQPGETSGESRTSTGKTFRYNSDGDSQVLYYRRSVLQSNMNVTRHLTFDDTSILNRSSEGPTVEEDFRMDSHQQDEVHEKDLEVSKEEEEDDALNNQTDGEADDAEEGKTPSSLEHAMSFMSIGSGEENSQHEDQDNQEEDINENLEDDDQDADQDDPDDDRQEESEEDAVAVPTRRREVIEDSDKESVEPVQMDRQEESEEDGDAVPTRRLRVIKDSDEESDDPVQMDRQEESEEDGVAVPTRRRRVIKDSDEESDDPVQEDEDPPSPLSSPAAEDSLNPDQPLEEEDELEDDQEEEEERTQPSDDHHHDSDEYEGDEEVEYQDSFIDDEDYSEEEGSSEEEYEGNDQDENEEEEFSGEEEQVATVALTDEQKRKYQDLVNRGRLHESNKNVKKALACYLTALEIDGGDRDLERRTLKLAQLYKEQKSAS